MTILQARTKIVFSNIELSGLAGASRRRRTADTARSSLAAEGIREAVFDGIDRRKNARSIADDIQRANLLNAESWRTLYEIEKELIDQYKYMDAYKVRKASGRCSLDLYTEGVFITNRLKLIWDLISDDRLEEAERLAENLNKKAFFQRTKEKIETLQYILDDDRQRRKATAIPIYDLGINGRSVVVVGPLADPAQIDEADHSDSYRIAINHTAKKKGSYQASFYNNEMSGNIAEQSMELPYDHVDLFCFYNARHRFQRNQFSNGRARLIWGADHIFGLGQPNLLQTILFHLAHEGSKDQYLTGFNMYLSQNVYGEDWRNYAMYGDKDAAEVSFRSKAKHFSVHNVISQFVYTKLLYDRGFFKCDAVLKKILDDGIEIYLEKLQTLANS